MIFYFSGAGNSAYVARRVAEASGERLIDLARCVAEGEYAFDCSRQRRVGFVFPVHFWGLPAIVAEFLAAVKLQSAERCHVFSVATYGTSSGQANWMVAKALRQKGLELHARYGVRMVDTWTPLFDLTDACKCRARETKAEAEIAMAAQSVSQCREGRFDRSAVPHLFAGVYHSTYGRQRLTRRFSVIAGRCSGCGLCASRCPSEAIKIEGGTPVWVKERCTLCLRCLHHCPGFAIQRGRHTAGHGQYVNPHECK